MDLPGLVTGRLTVLAVYGDTGVGTALELALAAQGETQLVVDLGSLDRLSPDAAEILLRFAAAGAARGRLLRLAACPADAAAVMDRARGTGAAGPELYPTVPDALTAAVTTAAASGTGAEPGAALRPHALRLRHRLLAQACIARAQGILVERYGLRDPQAAGTLLRAVARAHGMTRAVLAAELTRTPRPGPGEPGFPDTGPTAQPAVGFLGSPGALPLTQAAFLDALRDAVCAVAHARMADVQLLDRSDNTLWLESHCGFPDVFVRFFAVIDDAVTTACGEAARKSERVVVEDVVTAPYFDEDSRAVLLAAHCRSLQSTPIPGAGGQPQGMFSTHHARPGHAYTAAELGALDRIAEEAGAWLDWHRRTTLHRALEDLHDRARMI
ncbi:ANTAR domain-containing protein [Streptomyces sp. 5-8]|uniref:ANTAR domain-containing protein n=1 Tax=Streptomyces musisoli TaxID=2802280 RepID=A0ABS1PAP7_9ACTN|nr:ANTAR domain-containing protein [Streptomyces musisoli]MBL1109452.1 ANTAR domain-containing protein [Streptomyces musisoli]